MRVGLFIPCYIDQLYPQVGMATVEILEKFPLHLEYPEQQTCCGQPMANTGCTRETEPLAVRFLEIFRNYDAIVCPSGSCVSMVRHHYEDYLSGKAGFEELKHKTYELCEFLTDVLKVKTYSGNFPHQVGLHQSCHGLRELRLGTPSEVNQPQQDKVRTLVENLEGIQFTPLNRPDECCGFGGTFAVSEEAVSGLMGRDRIADHEQGGTEVLTATDMSCLMHLDGFIRRNRKPIKVMHIAEILSNCQPIT